MAGEITIATNGTLAGVLQMDDRYGNGSLYSRSGGVAGAYHFDVDGQVLFDFWPTQPGADEHWFWSDPAGTVLHQTPTRPGSPPHLWIATAATSSGSASLLTGNYVVRSLRLLPQGAAWTTRDVDAVLLCNGAGSGTMVGTERTVTPSGNSSLQSLSLGFAYTIAADGTLQALGGRGAVTEDGEFLFLVTQDPAQQEFGLCLGVKQGNSADLHDLAGRLSVSGSAFDLLTVPSAPSTASWFGTIELQAHDPTMGTAEVQGTRLVRTNQAVHAPAPLHSPAAIGAIRSGVSEVTLADAELQWTMSFSANGRYWLGREQGNPANLLFGVRQAARSEVIGINSWSCAPGLGMRGFPQLGNGNWGLRVDRGLGGAPALLAFTAQPTPGYYVLGQILWVDPTTALATAALVLGGAPGVPEAGSAEHAVPVPNLPVFAGLTMAVQAMVLEPQRPLGVGMSRGLLVRVGP